MRTPTSREVSALRRDSRVSSKPQIVIPMSGFGERFRRAGYHIPKPLIEVEGKPIIAHVVGLFPGEHDFIFICNQEHLDDPSYGLDKTLRACCPTGRVLGIPPHKRGPVYAVASVFREIDSRRPVVLNYCDFSCYWDWAHFKRFVEQTNCDGAIPAYRGFHPHSLGATNYAYLRENNGWVTDIQEKQPFTDNRMEEYASSGTYYFSSGALMQKAFEECMRRDLSVDGEYYVSLAYKPLCEGGNRIAVYELQHFMQWGTPEDLFEYQQWSDCFARLVDRRYSSPPRVRGTTLIPMAGLGERFRQEGFRAPKPLIPVSGTPMAIHATRDLPISDGQIFVLRRDMAGLKTIGRALQASFPASTTVVLDAATDGQARTALLGWKAANGRAVSGPLTIGACDNGTLYEAEKFSALLADEDADVIVWVTTKYPPAKRNPTMYGWVAREGNRITRISVKQSLGDPGRDPIVIGAFTFKRPQDFEQSVERMIARDSRVNGEFYIDSCINDAIALGLRVRSFEVDAYLCWGTPNELRTYEYWQSCFDKLASHPYTLDNDKRVDRSAITALRARYRRQVPPLPRVQTTR